MGAVGAAGLKRGDIILARERASPASRARPCVIVQRSGTLDSATKVTACPLTSVVHGSRGKRPLVAPSASNGLLKVSEVQYDWIVTFPVERCGPVIGQLDEDVMNGVDAALRRWLDL